MDQNEWQYSKIDESLSINIYISSKDGEGQSTCDLNGEFLHLQILIDCLIRMKTSPKDVKELIYLCKNNNFKKMYSSEKALWWYTRQSFLYRLLNKALRIQDIDAFYLFRFLIHDIE